MTTGAKHKVLTEISMSITGDDERRVYRDCRCLKGADHDASPLTLSQFDPSEDEDDDEGGESLSVYDAANIWRSRGEDEDYTFGYSEDELRGAADED